MSLKRLGTDFQSVTLPDGSELITQVGDVTSSSEWTLDGDEQAPPAGSVVPIIMQNMNQFNGGTTSCDR